MYKWRYLVENFFAKVKEFRRIATHYDKTDLRFAALIHFDSTILALQ
jgi:transposase